MLETGVVDNFEVQRRRKDGSIFWASLTAIPNTSRPNNREFIVITQDITSRRLVEEELKKHYIEEIKLRQALETEVQRRTEFTRALVHELKTPLTPMLATSELMVSNMVQEPWARMARNINRSAHHLNSRIEELLDLARGEIGMLKISPQPLDVIQMLRDLTNEMTPEAFMYEQSLSMSVPEKLPLVMGDELRLRQVLMNLINNACKFGSSKGSVTVSAELGSGEIVFCVRDTGPGISEDDQKRLFEAYHRLESDRERLSGLGLGLSLAKTIVELHKGRIWVTSEKGNGSTFSFTIPIPGVLENES